MDSLILFSPANNISDFSENTSLLVLPENYIEYSKIRLPYTNILEKTQLEQNKKYYHKILKKSRYVNSYIIDNKEKQDLDIYKETVNSIETESKIYFMLLDPRRNF